MRLRRRWRGRGRSAYGSTDAVTRSMAEDAQQAQQQQPSSPIVHVGLDEAGSLTAPTPLFTMAIVVTFQPESVRYLIRRVAKRSGKRLSRLRKAASELKWNNASQRIRSQVVRRLGQADVEVFALTVMKMGRRIEDAPENFVILACEKNRKRNPQAGTLQPREGMGRVDKPPSCQAWTYVPFPFEV